MSWCVRRQRKWGVVNLYTRNTWNEKRKQSLSFFMKLPGWIQWINGGGFKWELMQFVALCCEEMSSDVMHKGDQRWAKWWHVLHLHSNTAELDKCDPAVINGVTVGSILFTCSKSGSPTFRRKVLQVFVLHASWRYISRTKPSFAPDAAKVVPELHQIHFIYWCWCLRGCVCVCLVYLALILSNIGLCCTDDYQTQDTAQSIVLNAVLFHVK